jgi:dCMP deaminase
MTRPSWDEYGLAGAKWASMRGDCTRRKVGALILGPDHRTLGAGYNGHEPGGKSCLKGECLRGRHYWDGQWSGPSKVCACGNLWPCPDAAAPGTGYAESGCDAYHAERNAKKGIPDERLRGATMYISEAPCNDCRAMIKETLIHRVVWPNGEWYVHGE